MKKYKNINPLNFDTVLSLFENLSPEGCVVARERACTLTAGLFPFFNDDDRHDENLTDFDLEQYGYFRALGLKVDDTAYSLKMSAQRLLGFLNGDGLSFEKFVDLIQQELFARAECKARLLRDIEQSTNTKNWRTSLTLLEKLYPEEFGNRGGLEDKLDKLVEKAWTVNIVDPDVPSVKELENEEK